MNTSFRSPLEIFRLLRLVPAALCAAALTAAEPAPRTFNVPAGPAEKTLREFSTQAEVELIYSTDAVVGVATHPVKGEMSAIAALEQMLARTPLSVVKDAKPGAFAIRREGTAGPNAERAAQTDSDRPGQKLKVEDGTVLMEEVEVTGSRIRTLVGEQNIQPVITIDRRQIDRTGVTNFGDIFRYVPQVTNSSNGLIAPGSANGYVGQSMSHVSSSAGLTADLRGFGSGETLILIDGRRVNKTAQGQLDGARFDVMGLPVSAVERIEILLDGASAIYGADAVAGVINIITRKNYRGTELLFSYDNVFDRDAAERSATFTQGFARGKFSGSVSISYKDNTPDANRDTKFFYTADRRRWGGTDSRSSTITEGAGFLRSTTGANLPGLISDRVAIPVGSNGRNVTVADYANAGPPPAPYDYSLHAEEARYHERLVSLKAEYRWRSWLNLYFDGRAMRRRQEGTTNPPYYLLSGFTIPAGAPGNPFGVPVVAGKIFWDLPAPRSVASENLALTAGARGDLPGSWRYDIGLALNLSSTGVEDLDNPNLGVAAVQAALNSANPPVLLYDSQSAASPNPPGLLAALGGISAMPNAWERPVDWAYTAQADGPLWKLPAGNLRMALAAEYREEYADFRASGTFSPSLRPSVNRYTAGYAAELRVPVISAAQHLPLMEKFELSAAVRHDRYSDAPASTNPSYGVQFQPVKWLMLRGTFGEGYRAPDLLSKYRPISGAVQGPGSFARQDPLRGNQNIPTPFTILAGGNPDLLPETYRSKTAGVVAEVPAVKGLSFSYGRWETDYDNRILSGILNFLGDAITGLPQLFTRGPNLPGDPAGWPGPITTINSRSANIAMARLAGWDAGIKYDRSTPWGEFLLRAEAAQTTRNQFIQAPGQAPLSTIGTHNLPLQVTGSLFWARGAYDTGALFTYRDQFRATSTAPSTGAAIRWDWQGSYDFDQAAWMKKSEHRWLRAMLRGTRLSVTVFNVFNADPPQDGLGNFSLRVIGIKQQRYALRLIKKL